MSVFVFNCEEELSCCIAGQSLDQCQSYMYRQLNTWYWLPIFTGFIADESWREIRVW